MLLWRRLDRRRKKQLRLALALSKLPFVLQQHHPAKLVLLLPAFEEQF
jgi:hypothetical protein